MFSKGKRGGGRGGRAGKKKDLGRSQWAKQKGDKRQRNDDEQAVKKQRLDNGEKELPIYATKFSEEDLKGEERRPKRKVAVLIGYAGTGYKGMQMTHDHKTIEGDLFQAFVAAGVISKANADDPKKSSFVRCARTDKGVHAAGNVISLKLIVDGEDVVKKINDNLVPQIRVWGYERTNNSFSAYQMVDSRIYEYLIPTHSFMPPHPGTFLARKCDDFAEQKGEKEAFEKRQAEVKGIWEKIDQEKIQLILNEYDSKTRSILEKALYLQTTEELDLTVEHQETGPNNDLHPENNQVEPKIPSDELPSASAEPDLVNSGTSAQLGSITDASKRLRQAMITAKREFRIPKERLDRIRELLNMFVGTKNFHNFTIEKTFRDPSASRLIKSFVVNPTPILINGTEWLSLKVHGQSFMMHQIRKMVGMVALIIRCGCDPQRLNDAMGPDSMSIPKAPSLGLLLERPVFDSYNSRATKEFGKDAIDFNKYKTEMDEFKQREIYERMYRDEEKENIFGNFFNHIDNFPEPTFLFVTSGGIDATKTDQVSGTGQTKNPSKDATAAAAKEVDGESDDDNQRVLDDKNGDEG